MSQKNIINFIIIICLFFAAAISINSDALNRVALYFAIPLAFLLSFFRTRSFFPNKYMVILTALYFWDLITATWAKSFDASSYELHRILGAFLLSYIMAVNAYDNKMLKRLYLVYIILYLAAWYYTFNHSLIASGLELDSDDARLNDEKLNANTMAYYTFYVTTILYVIPSLVSINYWKKFLKVVFLLMVPISFFVALATASRQVLIIQVPLMAVLIFERYFRNASKKKKISFILIIIISLLFVLPVAIEVYNNSYLATRASIDVKEDSRWTLLNDSINVGLEHFPLGVGAGNYIVYSYNRHISHCSYTELFANNGIIGLLLYCYILSYFIKCQLQRYKQTKDRLFIFFLIFGFVFILDQLFYVFYTDLWLISFFILVATHSDYYYKSNYKSQQLRG